MNYTISIYEEGSTTPVIRGEYKTVLEAEAAIRTLTEKAEKIIAIKNS